MKRAASRFPNSNVALKAAGQVLLDGVIGIEYRVLPDDEPTRETLQSLARDFLETARQLEILDGAEGEAIVLEIVGSIVARLGFDEIERRVDAPF